MIEVALGLLHPARLIYVITKFPLWPINIPPHSIIYLYKYKSYLTFELEHDSALKYIKL